MTKEMERHLRWSPPCMRLELGETANKAEMKVKVNIKQVKLTDVSPSQKAAWQKWWQRLLAEVKSESIR